MTRVERIYLYLLVYWSVQKEIAYTYKYMMHFVCVIIYKNKIRCKNICKQINSGSLKEIICNTKHTEKILFSNYIILSLI